MYVDKYFNPNFKEGDLLYRSLAHPPLRPFYVDEPEHRLLFINPMKKSVLLHALTGSIPFIAQVDGTVFQFVSPKFPNVPDYDLRNIEEYKEWQDCLNKLGIKHLSLQELYPGDIQLLRAFENSGLTYYYANSKFYNGENYEHLCPQRSMKTELRECEYVPTDPAECQKCVDQSGSPFGFVNVEGWREEWSRFTGLKYNEALKNLLQREINEVVESK